MRSSFIAVLLAAGLSSSVAQAQDWSGFYGGLSLGRATADMDYGDDGSLDADFKGGEMTAFVGYNFQNGPMVYGAELAYSNSGLEDVTDAAETFKSFLDLKGRAGYASGQVLYYGVLGYSKNTYFRTNASINSTGNGLAYGIGAEFAASDRVFVGAEILRRNFQNDRNVDYVGISGDIQTVSIRAGMKF